MEGSLAAWEEPYTCDDIGRMEGLADRAGLLEDVMTFFGAFVESAKSLSSIINLK